jgi:hypothetical protein
VHVEASSCVAAIALASDGLARWLPTPLCACQSLGNGRAIPLPEITDLSLSAACAPAARRRDPDLRKKSQTKASCGKRPRREAHLPSS